MTKEKRDQRFTSKGGEVSRKWTPNE